MTIDQFKGNYKLKLSHQVHGDTATFFAEAIERTTGNTVATQKVSFSITEMKDGIEASHSPFAINTITVQDVIDSSNRFATDLLFRLCQVQDYFPLNKENNIYQLQN